MPLDLATPLTSTLLAGLIGLIMGSFISMLSWRLPRLAQLPSQQQLYQITLTRSKCPTCQNTLQTWQLIPLLSWLMTKGRCSHCQSPISWRYPIIELSSALITAGIIYSLGLSEQGITGVVLAWFLLTLSVIDLEHQLLLDSLTLPLIWLGLLINTQHIWTTTELAIWGSVTAYLILWSLYWGFKLLTQKEGMGYGDFKLFAALGAWFGPLALPQIMLIASTSTLIYAFGLRLTDRPVHLQTAIPFGPFLALGGLSWLFFPYH